MFHGDGDSSASYRRRRAIYELNKGGRSVLRVILFGRSLVRSGWHAADDGVLRKPGQLESALLPGLGVIKRRR